MSDIRIYYRADVPGLIAGSPTSRATDPIDGRDYTTAVTNPDVARGFALLQALGKPHPTPKSVYRVTLDQPLVWDPYFPSTIDTWFVMSHWGTVVEVVEEQPAMTLDEARKVLSRYALWADKSPMYDDEGYATVPPGMDVSLTPEQFRRLGIYPPPSLISRWAVHVAANG